MQFPPKNDVKHKISYDMWWSVSVMEVFMTSRKNTKITYIYELVDYKKMTVPRIWKLCKSRRWKERNELPAYGGAEAGLIADDENVTLCLDKKMSFQSRLNQREQVLNISRKAIPKLRLAFL